MQRRQYPNNATRGKTGVYLFPFHDHMNVIAICTESLVLEDLYGKLTQCKKDLNYWVNMGYGEFKVNSHFKKWISL